MVCLRYLKMGLQFAYTSDPIDLHNLSLRPIIITHTTGRNVTKSYNYPFTGHPDSIRTDRKRSPSVIEGPIPWGCENVSDDT